MLAASIGSLNVADIVAFTATEEPDGASWLTTGAVVSVLPPVDPTSVVK
jgi:hypothetical protein